MEVPCAANVCDTGKNDQLVCDEDHEDHEDHHDQDHGDEHAEAESAPMGSGAARKSALVGSAALLAMLV